MKPENIDSTNETLRTLIASAVQFYGICATEYAEKLPNDSAAYGELWKAGKLVPGMKLVLTNPPCIEVGYQCGDAWVRFFSYQSPKPPSDSIN